MHGTPQERFWAGEFGDEYIDRNRSPQIVASNIWLFARALRRAGPIRSVVELGANIGLNCQALKALYPNLHFTGVEINSRAANELRTTADEVIEASILDWRPSITADLALIKGVLIHINPDRLNDVYRALLKASRRLILICEYYNPNPVEVEYRGHSGRLFKRDFAGEMLERFPLRLVDYGFGYRNDPVAPVDDANWFLLERA